MKKINICAKITSTDFGEQAVNTIGTKDNNIIKYIENEKEICIKILKDKIVLYKKSSQDKIKLEFTNNKNNNSYIKIKDINVQIPISIVTKEIVIKENKIHINYYIDNEEYIYDISWRC